MGQSSLPIWVLGAIEFIWAGGIPLKPNHKIIPPQNIFFGTMFYTKKLHNPKCRPNISPRADYGNFPKSLRKVRTANPSEILSRTRPSKLQTEPRGEKHIFHAFPVKIQSVALETYHLRILFEVLDPGMGCLVLDTHFPRKCFKNIDFYTVWEPLGVQNRMNRMKRMCRMKRMKAKRYTTGTSDPRFSAPEARMTAVKQTPSNYVAAGQGVCHNVLNY